LGASSILAYGGEFLGTSTETIANGIIFSGASTFAAATGTTLTLSGSWEVVTPGTITIGSPAEAGVVSWTSSAVLLSPSSYTPNLDVRDGVFVLGNIDEGLNFIGSSWGLVNIAGGSTLELASLEAQFNI
jgi:hypothetical protein